MAARKIAQMNLTQARDVFSGRVKAAETGGEDTVVTRHGKNIVILLGMEEYRRLREAAGEPTEL